jgi:NADH-quinone oxidoreductase subunit A
LSDRRAASSATRHKNNTGQHLGLALRSRVQERHTPSRPGGDARTGFEFAAGPVPESGPMNPYVVFLMYLMAILGFVAVTLLLNRVLGPKPVATATKLEPFECGATPVTTLNVKAVPIKYYAVAIIFILFDLETVFLFIWALGAQPLTGFMLFTFFLFMFLLVLILLYVYKARLIEAVTE